AHGVSLSGRGAGTVVGTALELVLAHGTVVLLQGLREYMAAVATGDEVQALARYRVERGVDCLATDQGDRGRWHAVDDVGVVGRRLEQMSAGQVAVVALAEAEYHR